MRNRFIFTCGDINGIGPEIVIKTINRLSGTKGKQFIIVCPANVFEATAAFVNPGFKFSKFTRISELDNQTIILFDPGKFKFKYGKPTFTSGKSSYLALEIARDLLIKNLADALITAPISKTALSRAGYNFPGHTEMLAEWFGADNFVMMFLSKKIKAALATIHEPVSAVPQLITKDKLKSVIEVVITSLQLDFHIYNPKIGITGLNPHAGEEGLIGDEEEKILKPFLKNSPKRKYLSGPFPADAYWGNKLYENFDLTLGMYHDQVLIPFKLLNFSRGVNYTAGLPIIRTSPDHGVAYDIAGKNLANENSMVEAFHFADLIINNRKR
ncbi:MAG TPA: 4-hydroxythreonine-4-phosphate dehydrogenase PdxA [Ignavibacteriaceae bacterium]|nr:4-hydroxythreonine-4-phosphate dehydrogenase PdxA [Ignavibacteriaceae bacterium]